MIVATVIGTSPTQQQAGVANIDELVCPSAEGFWHSIGRSQRTFLFHRPSGALAMRKIICRERDARHQATMTFLCIMPLASVLRRSILSSLILSSSMTFAQFQLPHTATSETYWEKFVVANKSEPMIFGFQDIGKIDREGTLFIRVEELRLADNPRKTYIGIAITLIDSRTRSNSVTRRLSVKDIDDLLLHLTKLKNLDLREGSRIDSTGYAGFIPNTGGLSFSLTDDSVKPVDKSITISFESRIIVNLDRNDYPRMISLLESARDLAKQSAVK